MFDNFASYEEKNQYLYLALFKSLTLASKRGNIFLFIQRISF